MALSMVWLVVPGHASAFDVGVPLSDSGSGPLPDSGGSTQADVGPDSGSTGCTIGEFTCGDATCILSDWVCDGVLDCADGEDESGCGTCVGELIDDCAGGCAPAGLPLQGLVSSSGMSALTVCWSRGPLAATKSQIR